MSTHSVILPGWWCVSLRYIRRCFRYLRVTLVSIYTGYCVPLVFQQRCIGLGRICLVAVCLLYWFGIFSWILIVIEFLSILESCSQELEARWWNQQSFNMAPNIISWRLRNIHWEVFTYSSVFTVKITIFCIPDSVSALQGLENDPNKQGWVKKLHLEKNKFENSKISECEWEY